jgi:hypothetical protein
MCLTEKAMFLFLSLLPPDIVERSPSAILIRAEVSHVLWTNVSTRWCIQDVAAVS